jgi:hypothetical protein
MAYVAKSLHRRRMILTMFANANHLGQMPTVRERVENGVRVERFERPEGTETTRLMNVYASLVCAGRSLAASKKRIEEETAIVREMIRMGEDR